MGGGGKGGGKQEVSTGPWSGQDEHLHALYAAADALKEQQYYPESTITPFGPQTEQALGMREQRALAGSPLLPSAQQENLLTTGGGYLDIANTPGFQSAFEASRRQISPYIQGQAAGVGRYGGGLSQESEMRALGDAFAQQWAPLYQGERNRMQQATLAAPGLAQADYADIGQLGAVGAAREAKSQQQLSDEVARWQFEQMEPERVLGTRSAIIQGMAPGSQQTRPTYGQNPLMGALGGGMAGYSALGPALQWAAPSLGLGTAATAAGAAGPAAAATGLAGPWGLAAGAGLGALSGALK